MFVENNLCYYVLTAQSNLQIHCNLNQNSNKILLKTRVTDAEIHVETRETSNS